MTIKLIKNGCPVCHSDVKGDKESKYYCKRCNILYDEFRVREHFVEIIREEPVYDKPIVKKSNPPIEVAEPYQESSKVQFLDNDEGKIALVGVKREKGYLYFIDKIGDVSKVKMARSRADKGPRVHFKVVKVGVTKEKGYLYYLDKDGDVSRAKMKRYKSGN